MTRARFISLFTLPFVAKLFPKKDCKLDVRSFQNGIMMVDDENVIYFLETHPKNKAREYPLTHKDCYYVEGLDHAGQKEKLDLDFAKYLFDDVH